MMTVAFGSAPTPDKKHLTVPLKHPSKRLEKRLEKHSSYNPVEE